MPVGFRTGLRLRARYRPLCCRRFKLFRILTLEMGTQAAGKRPFCPSCLKPTRLCLCVRMKTSSMDNSIAVTILQHSQERKHPLNSTRIATLGLKNLTVATVSDVHFEAQFIIHLLQPDSDNTSMTMEGKSGLYSHQNRSEKSDINPSLDTQAPQDSLVEADLNSNLRKGSGEKSDYGGLFVSPDEMRTIASNAPSSIASDLKGSKNSRHQSGNTDVVQNPASVINDFNDRSASIAVEIPQKNLEKQQNCDLVIMPPPNETLLDGQKDINRQTQLLKSNLCRTEAAPSCEEEPVITATIAKCGFTCSLTQLRTSDATLARPDFDQLLFSRVGQAAVSNGFVVKKLQKKQLNGSMKSEEHEEFKIVIPPGSALLFPTKKSVDLEAANLEVKHLIVLDGTWAKAKRMYHENPWLKLLPHLKLDPSKTSLYYEVRHQPKAGCLSTIESIVCALKALGDNSEGLDDLLDVFESMIRDQRRCKDERLSKISCM